MKNFVGTLALIAVALSSAQARPPCSSDLPEVAATDRGDVLTAAGPFYTVPIGTTTETETPTEYEYESTTAEDTETGYDTYTDTTVYAEPTTTGTSDYMATDYEETTTADYVPTDDSESGYGGDWETSYADTTTTGDYAPTDDSGYGTGPDTTTHEAPTPEDGPTPYTTDYEAPTPDEGPNPDEVTDEAPIPDDGPTPDNGEEDMPHSDDVLLEVWRNAGCTTTFPVNEGPDGWWRNHELVIVENDMQLWYEYAMDGQSTYRAACFGNQEDLLMQWWREAGCTSDFPMWEKPDGFWHVHTEEVVRADMARWYENAVAGEPLYEAACKPAAPTQGQ